MNLDSWKNRGAEMLKTGLFCDIFILVEDVKFPCHRFMLARASEFFEKMFQRDGIDTGVVRLEDTTSTVFQIIRNFIYTEKTELLTGLDYKTLVKVLQNANMWLISEVEEICIDLLRKEAQKMKPEILVEMYAIFYLLNNKSFLNEIIKSQMQESLLAANRHANRNWPLSCEAEKAAAISSRSRRRLIIISQDEALDNPDILGEDTGTGQSWQKGLWSRPKSQRQTQGANRNLWLERKF
nr:kelch-like protein 36 [Drosophila bipectinata]